MKTPFLQPHFEGERFDAHTLPLEVARDLAAYEELVVELAKHLYLRKHGARKRVPRGFEEQFSLHLERVDEGSARPLLSWVYAAGVLLNAGAASESFTEARDVIADCVQAASEDKPLPEAFPPHLLEYFNLLGRSLRDKESMALAVPGGGGVEAKLTPSSRKRLVLAAQKTYLREVELSGIVEEVDYAKKTFRLRLENGSQTVPYQASRESEIRQAGGVTRTRATVRGVGVYDAYDNLQKISEAGHLEILENYALAAKCEAIALMEAGWMDGSGEVPPKEEFAQLADSLVASFPADLALPFVCLTPDGHVFLEWKTGDWCVSAEVSLPGFEVALQATHTVDAMTHDEELKLQGQIELDPIYRFVRRFA